MVMRTNANGKETLELRMETMEFSEDADSKGLLSLGPELNECM